MRSVCVCVPVEGIQLNLHLSALLPIYLYVCLFFVVVGSLPV